MDRLPKYGLLCPKGYYKKNMHGPKEVLHVNYHAFIVRYFRNLIFIVITPHSVELEELQASNKLLLYLYT